MAKSALRFPPLPSVGDLLRLYNLRAMKALSQNFLMDVKLCSKVVSCSRRVKGFHIIEVGPGPGGLTRPILEQGALKLDVIEKDARFEPFLELIRDASGDPPLLNIHIGNIRRYYMAPLISDNLCKSWDDDPPKIHIIGNLPFNVSTPLIIQWLREISKKANIWKHGRVSMTLTFQKEVAERMVAQPNGSQRSRLSIMCQNWCQVDYNFTIPGRAFIPKPDVDVAVVTFIPKVTPPIDLEYKYVDRVVNAVFSMRQKYCRRGIETLFPTPFREEFLKKMMAVADVDPEKRPFQLTLPEFNRLAHTYAALVEENPFLDKYHHRHANELDRSQKLLELEHV